MSEPRFAVGVGMRPGATAQQIINAVREVLGDLRIACLATVDRRASETGLIEAAALLDVPLVAFSAAELARAEVPNPSPRTADALGTPSVAEAAALLAAGGGRLMVAKTVVSGITVAVAGVPR